MLYCEAGEDGRDPGNAAGVKQIERGISELTGLLWKLNGVAFSLRGRPDVAALRQEAAFRSLAMEEIMGVLVFIIIWLALCIAVGFYAEGKGRSGVGIFFLSLLLSPLVGLVAALAMHPDEKRVAAARGKKRCSECAEFVQPEAKICRFCQHKFTEAEDLAAAGIPAGPPCPKCGSVNTFSHTKRAAASHWWKKAEVASLRCRKCNEEWQTGNGAPVESISRENITVAVALIAVFAMVAWAGYLTRHLPKNATSPAGVSTAPAPAPSAKPPESNWHTMQSTDSIDGVRTTLITNGHGEQQIIIRFRGKTLEAYVTTPEVVDDEDAPVRVRFDGGKPISQVWSRSKDYRAVFSPNPRWLVAKLQTSRKFYIEYHPYEKVPETLSFDVAGLVVAPGFGESLVTSSTAAPDLEPVTVNLEPATIPSAAPYTVTVKNAAKFRQDLGVWYAGSRGQLVCTGSGLPRDAEYTDTPEATYRVSTGGVYSFSSEDSGVAVLISYRYTNAGGRRRSANTR
jgi:transposase-like protein